VHENMLGSQGSLVGVSVLDTADTRLLKHRPLIRARRVRGLHDEGHLGLERCTPRVELVEEPTAHVRHGVVHLDGDLLRPDHLFQARQHHLRPYLLLEELRGDVDVSLDRDPRGAALRFALRDVQDREPLLVDVHVGVPVIVDVLLHPRLALGALLGVEERGRVLRTELPTLVLRGPFIPV